VINFANDKHFGLVGVGQRGLEGNTAAGRQWEAACPVTPNLFPGFWSIFYWGYDSITDLKQIMQRWIYFEF
jgi:hypothetical protein